MDDDIELEIEEIGAEFVGGGAVGHDDQVMEEGEISDHGEDFNGGRQPRKKSLAERLGPRPNLKRSSFEHHREDPMEMQYRAKLPVCLFIFSMLTNDVLTRFSLNVYRISFANWEAPIWLWIGNRLRKWRLGPRGFN